MPSSKHTLSVRLDDDAKRRVEQAAKILKQSSGAFLGKAGEERARKVLVDWAVTRHRQGETSYSRLAEETGLAVEEIMEAAGDRDTGQALAMFLASCRTVAEAREDPEFFRLAEETVQELRGGM